MSSLQEAISAALASRQGLLSWPEATALQAMILEAYREDKAKTAAPKRPVGRPPLPGKAQKLAPYKRIMSIIPLANRATALMKREDNLYRAYQAVAVDPSVTRERFAAALDEMVAASIIWEHKPFRFPGDDNRYFERFPEGHLVRQPQALPSKSDSPPIPT